MKRLKGLFKRLVDKNVQKLYQAEFVNGDLELTDEGREELLYILFEQNKEELIKRADEVIKEKKNKKDEDENLEEI